MKKFVVITVLMALISVSNLTAVQSLRPIADLHPNDIGIEKDPDVLFTEKFNDGLPAILKRYDNIINGEGMTIDNTDVPPGSKEAATVKMTAQGGKNDGGHLYKLFKEGYDEPIYLRYYVKYPSSSKGYIHHEGVWFGGYNPGTRWPDPRAGICGLGDKRISVAYEPGLKDVMDTYLYWGDMGRGADNKCWGNDMVNGSPTGTKVAWDKWMCVEIMVKLNHPATAYNGELRIWEDGKEIGYWRQGFPNGRWISDSWHNDPAGKPFEGFRWRTTDDLKINFLWIEFYDDRSPEGTEHHIKYANLVMAKRYIGPIKN